MRSFRILIAAAAVATLAAALPAAEEKTNLPGPGTDRIGIMKPIETTAGTFEGTWMYVNRDARFAMWIRNKDGARQVRLQFQSLANPEAFETDWDGKATYYMGGKPITFELKLTQADASMLAGSWSWIAKFDTAGRVETADVVVHRTTYGRTLLMDFKNYQKIITRDGVDHAVKVPTTWNWTKISNRELLWEELPF